MKRVTIKDVAVMAGVSPATVSRVVSGDGRASQEVAGKVRAAADQLGYRPSVMARSLTQSSTQLIAFVMGSLQNPFDAALVEALSAGFYRTGKRLLIVPADHGDNDSGPMTALDYQTDGVVVAAGHISQSASERLARLGIPVILFGRMLEAPGVDCIVADNFEGARRAGRLIARSGAKRVTAVRHAWDTFSDDERVAGLCSALKGRARVEVVKTPAGNGFGEALMLLSGPERPDAVFCVNDVLAIGVLDAAAAVGLRVPEDLSVIGFDDIPMASSPLCGLTTLRLPVDEVAGWIIERLLRRLEEPGLAVERHRVPTPLIVRGSTRRVLSATVSVHNQAEGGGSPGRAGK